MPQNSLNIPANHSKSKLKRAFNTTWQWKCCWEASFYNLLQCAVWPQVLKCPLILQAGTTRTQNPVFWKIMKQRSAHFPHCFCSYKHITYFETYLIKRRQISCHIPWNNVVFRAWWPRYSYVFDRQRRLVFCLPCNIMEII